MVNFKITLNGKEAHNLFLISEPVACGERFQLSLILTEDTVIDELDVIFPLDFTKEALIYNNGFCTNDFAFVTKLSDTLVSRDIVMIKEQDKCFSLAMASGNTFLTRFISTNDQVILRHYFEGKTYKKGNYPLEEFVASDTLCGGRFFSLYCDYLKEKFNIKLPEHINTGWSSWSCLYGTVTQEDVLTAAKELDQFDGADLIQIDDGWQQDGTFGSNWTKNTQTFSMGIEALSKELKEQNKRLGLWFAPTMMSNTSPYYKEHYDHNVFYGDRIERSFGGNAALCANNDGSIFPLDLENEEVLEFIESSFRNAVENYDCHYFKIDFLVRSLVRCVNGSNLPNVTYNSQPSVRAYQNCMKRIRQTVGDDAFLMACGAPITESIGVFNAIRTSPDITWVSSKGNRAYTYWQIVEKDIQNIFLRSYYNGKVFAVDADALIVRGNMGRKNDDFTPTLEEARTWATTIALSGGSVLINEEIEKLPPERLALIKEVMFPIGIAAYPEDFFEYPSVSKVSLFAGNKRIAAKYNWDTEEKECTIFNNKCVLAFDCWSKEYLGEYDGDISLNIAPHGVRALLLVEKPDTDTVVASCDDFYMGITKELNEEAGSYKYIAETNSVIKL